MRLRSNNPSNVRLSIANVTARHSAASILNFEVSCSVSACSVFQAAASLMIYVKQEFLICYEEF